MEKKTTKEEDLVGNFTNKNGAYILKILAARFSGENIIAINASAAGGYWEHVQGRYCRCRPLQKREAVDCTVNLRHQPPLPPPTDLKASPLSFCDNAKRCSKNNDECSLSQNRILLIGSRGWFCVGRENVLCICCV
jgi:hypothetical protein